MKTLNIFILERLKLDKDSKVKPPMSEKEITKYVLAVWGFADVDNYHPSDTAETQCLEAIKDWISMYNITNITGSYYGGESASEKYFKSLQEHMEKELGKEVLNNFKYEYSISINDIDVWKNKENKIKLRGYDIYIVYDRKAIGIITNGDYKEARVVEA